MTTNLYDVLGIGRHATAEDVRKAYRRKALETHPDRLPQGASAAEKSAAEDRFRKINNAYEVLHDPQSRSEYDQYGVWPPPSVPQGPSANGPYDSFSDSFRDPFFPDPFFRAPRRDPFGSFDFGPQHGPRGFTDPFVLFNSIFGDLQRAFETDPFFGDPFGRRGFGSGSNHPDGGFFGGGFPSMLPSPFVFNDGGMGNSSSNSGVQTFSGGSNGGRWVSQSWTTSTVNGATHTKSVRRDAEGNEHVTYRYPDGTERRTINGIEQSTSQPQRALLAPPPGPPVPYPTQVDNLSPPYYDSAAQPLPRSRSSRHHVQFYDPGDKREDRHRHRQDYGQARDRDREYDDWTRHGYRDDGYGRDGQGSSSWKSWRS